MKFKVLPKVSSFRYAGKRYYPGDIVEMGEGLNRPDFLRQVPDTEQASERAKIETLPRVQKSPPPAAPAVPAEDADTAPSSAVIVKHRRTARAQRQEKSANSESGGEQP